MRPSKPAPRQPERSTSIVSERLRWLQDTSVTVRVTPWGVNDCGESEFTAIYRDVYPLGTSYFFLFDQAGKLRLISTTAVAAIAPVGEN